MMKKLLFILLSIFAFSLMPVGAYTHDSDNNTIIIASDSLTQDISAEGKQVIIDGNYNKLQIIGITTKLIITGSYNDVDIDTVSGIIVSGNHNFVTWRAAAYPADKPMLIDRGGYNNVGKR